MPKKRGKRDVQKERHPHRSLKVALHDALFGERTPNEIDLGKAAVVHQRRGAQEQ